jgi:AraC family transcriptional regulator, regulatory protein of adaptative response / methylated-DNA-[protein]-cysteine methyltransferase
VQNLTASHVSDRDEYLHFISLESSLGFALTAVSPRGICAILMGDTREELERELRREFPAQSPAYSDFGLEGIGAQTVKAIETPQLGVSLPLDLQGTPMQISVWQALQAIPIGETATYEEIARRIGASNAVASVLQACLHNKIAVAIPCHRVMGILPEVLEGPLQRGRLEKDERGSEREGD